MANEIRSKFGASTAMALTSASLADVGARQSDMVNNESANFAQFIHVYFKITTGTSPTVNKSIEFFLLKGDDGASANLRTDNAGVSDAGITIETAPVIHVVQTDDTSDKTYYGGQSGELLLEITQVSL